MKINRIFLALSLALSVNAMAQPLTSQQAVRKIVENNPRLRSAESEVKSQEIANNAFGKAEFTPAIDYTHTFGREGAKIDAGVSMDFDWPSLYGKRKNYASSANMIGVYRYLTELYDVEQQAMSLLTDGAYAEIRLGELNHILSVLERARELIVRGFEGGSLTIIDVRKAELEVTSAQLRIAETENELQDVRTQLCALADTNNLQVDMTAYLPLQLPSLDVCLAVAEGQPDVFLARTNAWVQENLAKIERAQRKPGFSLGYVYQRELGENFNGFSVGLRLPVRSKLYAAAADSEALRYEKSADMLANTHRINALRTHSRAEWLRTKIDALSAAALGNNYVELVEKAWRGGQINVLTYLQEVGYYLDTRMAVLALEHEYRLALVNLNRYSK